jgi:capsular exopolysaccharide synthesis family protein
MKGSMLEDNGNARMPVIIDAQPQYVTVPLSAAQYSAAAEGEGGQSVPLGHYLWILKRHRWKLLLFIAICVSATAIISLRLVPVYEATAIVDIDRQLPTAIVGQEATRSTLNDSDQFLATQLKHIQSDSVLRPVVQKYKLRETEADSHNSIAEEQAPVKLKRLKVTRAPNTYLLLISYRSTDPKLSADVANAIAKSYIEHTYNLRFRASANLSTFMEQQTEELKAKMERSTAALAQFERELNVINPEEKTSILTARLLQLNTEFTNAQGDRVRKQAAAQSLASGKMEAALSSHQGESLRKLVEHLNDAQEKFAQIKIQYGVNHPEYRKGATQVAAIERLLEQTRHDISQRVDVEYAEALSRERMLREAVDETKTEFDRLNTRSFEYQQLKREAEADKTLYSELMARIREAGINANFQNSSIRLADPARPPINPVFPKVPLNVLLAALFSSLAGIAAVIITDTLDTTVRDPDEVARTLNTTVVGTLPSVKNWRKRLAPVSMAGALTAPEANEDPAGFGESIRTLRNSILLADIDRRVRSMLVTSASPAEGKSTTAAYLAVSHAQQGKRTLLIDGDMRRPSLHRRFGLPGTVGLSNVLLGEIPWRETIINPQGVENLDIVVAGPPSRRASDLIGSRLTELLDEASREYDLIILDAPPLLGFAEPLQMALEVDGVLIVARAGETNRKAIGSVVNTLTRLRARVIGIVLNEVKKDMSDSYYYYGHHYSYYKPSEV